MTTYTFSEARQKLSSVLEKARTWDRAVRGMRARWRGLWRMRIQEYLTCTIQNIQVLIKNVFKPTKSIAVIDMTVKTLFMKTVSPLIAAISSTFYGLQCHEALPLQRI